MVAVCFKGQVLQTCSVLASPTWAPRDSHLLSALRDSPSLPLSLSPSLVAAADEPPVAHRGSESGEAANDRFLPTRVYQINVGFLPATENMDLGELDANTAHRIRIELVNYTEQELTISKIKTSCGCMKENAPAEAIQPGESGKVHILFEAPAVPGNLGKTASFCFNDECSSLFAQQLFAQTDCAEYAFDETCDSAFEETDPGAPPSIGCLGCIDQVCTTRDFAEWQNPTSFIAQFDSVECGRTIAYQGEHACRIYYQCPVACYDPMENQNHICRDSYYVGMDSLAVWSETGWCWPPECDE